MPDLDAVKISHGLMVQMAYVREDKRWKIFSWASSLLIASIAGQAFFADNISPRDKNFLGAAILVLSLYSIIWLAIHGVYLQRVIERVAEYSQELGVEMPPFPRFQLFAYEVTVILLGVLAILMTFWHP